MSKEKGCKCCKQIWYVDMLDKKLKLCPNCYEYCKPLFDDLKIKDKQIAKLEAKLAEKDKEIEIVKHERNANGASYMSACKMLTKERQDKISFAVDILEELADCSNYINSKLGFESGSYVPEKSIRDKIKYLKGNKYE